MSSSTCFSSADTCGHIRSVQGAQAVRAATLLVLAPGAAPAHGVPRRWPGGHGRGDRPQIRIAEQIVRGWGGDALAFQEHLELGDASGQLVHLEDYSKSIEKN